MSLKRRMKNLSNGILRHLGQELVATGAVYDWQRDLVYDPGWNRCTLSEESASYLRPDHPKLKELRQRYSVCDADVITPSNWNDAHIRTEDIAYFRGDNAWVWQVRGKNTNVLAYAISFYYLKAMDHLKLLDKLTEDDDFGAFTFSIGGRTVSRDLLDSVGEIYFLDRHLQLCSRKGIRILDIGAGYGRLAHRMVSALEGVERYCCTDAVAVSTFVSDYYLRFRGVERAVVVPLDEIDAALGKVPVDLAINIHSFSECRLQAIEWWIRFVSKHRVKNLLIVPNHTEGGDEPLLSSIGEEILPVLTKYGYRQIALEPKYLDPVVQQYGVEPSYYHLFELGA